MGSSDQEKVQPLHDLMNEIERLKEQNHIFRQRYDHQAKALQHISDEIIPFGRSLSSLQSPSSEWKHANHIDSTLSDTISDAYQYVLHNYSLTNSNAEVAEVIDEAEVIEWCLSDEIDDFLKHNDLEQELDRMRSDARVHQATG